MITPGIHNFSIYRGATLRKTFLWTSNGTPVNLTGYTAKAQFRISTALTAPVALELTSPSGILIVNLTGSLTMLATDVQMLALTEDHYHYGLHVVDTQGDTLSLIEGVMTIVPGAVHG